MSPIFIPCVLFQLSKCSKSVSIYFDYKVSAEKSSRAQRVRETCLARWCQQNSKCCVREAWLSNCPSIHVLCAVVTSCWNHNSLSTSSASTSKVSSIAQYYADIKVTVELPVLHAGHTTCETWFYKITELVCSDVLLMILLHLYLVFNRVHQNSDLKTVTFCRHVLYTYTHTWSYIHTYIRVYIHIQAHTCIYKYIHT